MNVSGGNAVNSPLKYELMLLSALMQKQDDSCWEQRLRLVIHILLRSLNVAESTTTTTTTGNVKNRTKHLNHSNPILMECLTLPCLRILNHVCKTTTNLTLLSSIATSTTTTITASASSSANKFGTNMSSILRPSLFQGPNNSPIGLNRFYSEPHDTAYSLSNSLHTTLNNNYLAVAPGLHELDAQEFLQSKTQQSYYDKWLQLSHKNREQQQTKVTSAHTTTMVENSSDEKLPTPPPEPPSPQVYHNQTLDPKKKPIWFWIQNLILYILV